MASYQATFLRRSTPGLLCGAAAENHVYWVADAAESVGGRVTVTDGVTWVHTPHKKQIEIMFPRILPDRAAQTVDRIVRLCRRRDINRLACWSLDPARPRDLGALLVARGFEWNWKPRWMWLKLDRLNTSHRKPGGLTVELAGDEDVWDIDDMPYYNRTEAEGWRVLNNATPRRAWQFVGKIDGEVVGQTKLNVTTGRLGIAGIYNVGVRKAFRQQGIAKAIIGKALDHAAGLGCIHAMLNGTGEAVYRQLGFEVIGYGQTWVSKEALRSRYPSKGRIAYAEAIARSDIATLDLLAKKMPVPDLNKPFSGGMTPAKLAVEMKQIAALKWLLESMDAQPKHI
jgi:predicted N-acetyltransferase YhbS